MQFQSLKFERDQTIARVTLNRPERLNALDGRLIEELSAAARLIDAEPGIRAVLLGAAGRAFCAGADLAEDRVDEAVPAARAAAVAARLRDALNPMASAWFRLRAPLVVAVNGIAAGAGASLALCGDIVVAGRSAAFAQLFAPKLALMPDLGGTFHLPRLVGAARAKGLALLGDPLPAAEAAAWGLIWACVEDSELLARTEAIARRLADGPTQAHQRIKTVFNEPASRTFELQLEREAVLQAELAGTGDFTEGLRAFREKRPPRFEGR